MLEGGTVEVLHDDVGAAFLIADVVDGADVGMVESGGGAGFALEAAQSLRVAGDLVGEKFEGDEAVEASVFGFVDHAHAATAEFLEHAVVRDGLANHFCSCAGVKSYGRGWGKSTDRGGYASHHGILEP